MSETELKPCPFCGSQRLHEFILSSQDYEGHAIECLHCRCQCPETAWNSRAGQPRPAVPGTLHKIVLKDVPDLNTVNTPLPLSVIPNHMGINLCSVDSLEWIDQADGQLVSVKINFIPEPPEGGDNQ